MKLCTFLLLLCLLAASAAALDFDVVLRGGESFQGLEESETQPTFRDGRCVVRPQLNGNFAVAGGFLNGGWDGNNNASPECRGRTYEYTLQEDGNFVFTCGPFVDYATHTGQGSAGDYFLAIDDDCILHLYEGKVDCDSVSVGEELWTNIKLSPLVKDQRLGENEYVWDKENQTRLLVQGDGNLVLYKQVGSRAADSIVLWAANQEWGSPPPDRSSMNEFYARISHNGFLTLVGIDYYGSSRTETIYFEKDLGSGRASCFTVEFDGIDDLIAVPCGDTRERNLRGHS